MFLRLAHFGDALRRRRSTKLCWSSKAAPWDPKGSREETDNFVFPPLGPRPASQGVQPLEKPDTAELPDDPPHGEEELFQEVMEHFHDMVQESETHTSADAPVHGDMDIEELAEGLLKRAREPAQGATSSAEPSILRVLALVLRRRLSASVKLRKFPMPLRRFSVSLPCLGLRIIL